MDIVGGDKTSNAEFPATAASHNLVFEYMGCVGIGGAELRVGDGP